MDRAHRQHRLQRQSNATAVSLVSVKFSVYGYVNNLYFLRPNGLARESFNSSIMSREACEHEVSVFRPGNMQVG